MDKVYTWILEHFPTFLVFLLGVLTVIGADSSLFHALVHGFEGYLFGCGVTSGKAKYFHLFWTLVVIQLVCLLL